MANGSQVSALFLDIGGVVLTNGWDRQARGRTADHFALDSEEMDENHHLAFDTYEEGKLSLDDYLERLVFYRPRPFSPQQFKDFMFAQSQPFPEMIELVTELKRRYGLKVTAISNEGRELTIHRIRTFKLTRFFDAFVSSCFVHFRKPDPDIYRLALDVTQAPAEGSVYTDDRPMFVDVAARLGIAGILHKGFDSTRAALAEWGLSAEEVASQTG